MTETLTNEELATVRAQCQGGCRLFDGTERVDVCADRNTCALSVLCDMASQCGDKAP